MAPGLNPPSSIDLLATARRYSRASASFDETAVVHARAREELLSRLELLPVAPRSILDLGAGTGQAAAVLRKRFQAALTIALDLSEGMLAQARRRAGWWHPFTLVRADANRLPFRSGSFELVFSNLALHASGNLDHTLAEAHRVLTPGGLLLASTFGSQTLPQASAHRLPLPDVHDFGSALARAGFTEPVLDVDEVDLTYADFDGLLRDIRATAAVDLAADRPRGLAGRSRCRRLREALETGWRERRLHAQVELLHATAWKAPDEPPAARERRRGEILVPMSGLKRKSLS